MLDPTWLSVATMAQKSGLPLRHTAKQKHNTMPVVTHVEMWILTIMQQIMENVFLSGEIRPSCNKTVDALRYEATLASILYNQSE